MASTPKGGVATFDLASILEGSEYDFNWNFTNFELFYQKR